MVNSWCCAGITLTILIIQLPLQAGESTVKSPAKSRAKNKASSLPRKLTPSLGRFAVGSSRQYLITQERQGETRKFEIPIQDFSPSIPIEEVETIEVIADRQEYDRNSQVIMAEGNVTIRFAQSVLTGDRLEINLKDRIAVAQGNVVLKRGEQILRGEKFEYYLVSDRGIIYQAGGEIFQPSLNEDTDVNKQLPPERTILDRALSDRLSVNQPLTEVQSQDGLGTTIGSSRDSVLGNDNAAGGTINRLRFQAQRIEFAGDTWTANNLRLTNDPFSPPELELRAETAKFEKFDTLVNRLDTTKSRLVIDDSLTLPLLLSSFTFNGRPGRAGLFNVAFDGDERGGLYIERSWQILDREKISWDFTPQYFVQRAISPTTFDFSESDEGGLDLATLGLTTDFRANLTPRRNVSADISLTSLDFGEVEDNLRAKIGIQQTLGNPANPYSFDLAYNYRDRLFNGSLGFQTVQNSIGGVISSPNIAIGNTGVNLRYQTSLQNISADTDRADLLAADRDNERINLTRYQGAVFLNKTLPLWSGKPLPSTKEQGLRYTPVPVVPYVELLAGVSGVSSFYSNSDSQLSLEGNIGIQGQLGHFSRDWLDYTGFRVAYSQNIRGDESPFLFDRLVDRQALSLDLTQQIYGPIRLGFRTSIDLEDNDEISTDYIVEYSRRTHNITLRYNPVLEIGSFSLRISDFNWQGNPQPFDNEGVTPVVQGIER